MASPKKPIHRMPDFAANAPINTLPLSFLHQGQFQTLEISVEDKVVARYEFEDARYPRTITAQVASVLTLGPNRWLVAFYVAGWHRLRSQFMIAEYDGCVLDAIYSRPDDADDAPIVVPATEYHERIIVDIGIGPAKRGRRVECDWFTLVHAQYPVATLRAV